MQLYEYPPLPNLTSIRVFRLLPAGRFDKRVDVELYETDLECGPTYEALSFTWGYASKRTPIFCKGRVIQATPNCESALRRLRLRDKIRKIWVDAICIDQGSLDEKAHQVGMMGRIFGAAGAVRIWLGRERDPRLGECLSTLHRLSLDLLDFPSEEDRMRVAEAWYASFATGEWSREALTRWLKRL